MPVLALRRSDRHPLGLPLVLIAILGLLVMLSVLPVTRVAAVTAEGCPGSTTLAATFVWGSGAWSPAGDGKGISVSGDSSAAYWTAAFKVTAVVVTAAPVTLNYVYDPLETAGEIRESDIEGSTSPLSAIGFCTGSGAVPNPSSGSTISVGVQKTASCATSNPDGSLTVTGTITVVRHSPAGNPPPVRIQVRAARDTVFAPGNVALARITVTGLEGAVMETTATSISRSYTVTFMPGSATTFSNQVMVIVEEANSGLERHKYYSARASFAACAVATPTPTPTLSPEGSMQAATPTPKSTGTPEQGVQGATGSPGPLPNTALAASNGSAPIPLVGGSVLLLISLTWLTVMRRRSMRRTP